VLITPQYYLAEMAMAEDLAIVVSQSDFFVALQHLVPSISQLELDYYLNLQKLFSNHHSYNV